MSTAITTGQKLKAYQIGREPGIDGLEIRERQAAELAPNQVRIKMKAVSLNYRDLMVVKGQYSKSTGSTAADDLRLIPCSDGAGEVIEVGSHVSRFKVGDRVTGIFMQRWIAGELSAEIGKSAMGGAIDGMLAESVVLHENGLVTVPAHLSYEEAATLPCAAVTAWHALITAGKIKSGDTILTLGTGGVSLFAVQFAKLSGARVIVTSSSDEKIARLKKEMGVTDSINYKTSPDWEKEVLKLTGGRGVDHAIELGGAGTMGKSLACTRVGGHISLIGVLSGNTGEFNPVSVLMKAIRVQGIYVGSREMFEQMNAAISLHKLKPVIDRVFDFADAKKAFLHMESQSHFGKIVIRF